MRDSTWYRESLYFIVGRKLDLWQCSITDNVNTDIAFYFSSVNFHGIKFDPQQKAWANSVTYDYKNNNDSTGWKEMIKGQNIIL